MFKMTREDVITPSTDAQRRWDDIRLDKGKLVSLGDVVACRPVTRRGMFPHVTLRL